MRLHGQTVTKARPMTDESGMGPKRRLSEESQRLSPITKASSAGTVTDFAGRPTVPLVQLESR